MHVTFCSWIIIRNLYWNYFQHHRFTTSSETCSIFLGMYFHTSGHAMVVPSESLNSPSWGNLKNRRHRGMWFCPKHGPKPKSVAGLKSLSLSKLPCWSMDITSGLKKIDCWCIPARSKQHLRQHESRRARDTSIYNHHQVDRIPDFKHIPE